MYTHVFLMYFVFYLRTIDIITLVGFCICQCICECISIFNAYSLTCACVCNSIIVAIIVKHNH